MTFIQNPALIGAWCEGCGLRFDENCICVIAYVARYQARDTRHLCRWCGARGVRPPVGARDIEDRFMSYSWIGPRGARSGFWAYFT